MDIIPIHFVALISMAHLQCVHVCLRPPTLHVSTVIAVQHKEHMWCFNVCTMSCSQVLGLVELDYIPWLMYLRQLKLLSVNQ
jgi:hypothetical protein